MEFLVVNCERKDCKNNIAQAVGKGAIKEYCGLKVSIHINKRKECEDFIKNPNYVK